MRQVNPRTMGIPDLRGRAQRLDVRFIQFDNVVIELLQYRDAEQPAGSGASFAESLEHMSPAFPRMMHICSHIRDEVDFLARAWLFNEIKANPPESFPTVGCPFAVEISLLYTAGITWAEGGRQTLASRLAQSCCSINPKLKV